MAAIGSRRAWVWSAAIATMTVVVVAYGMSRSTSVSAVEGDEFGVAQVYHKSNEAGLNKTWAVHIPLGSIPRLYSNWPATNGTLCRSTNSNDVYRGVNNNFKALPILPGVPLSWGGSDPLDLVRNDSALTEYKDDSGDLWHSFNKNGSYRTGVGNCEQSYAAMGVDDNGGSELTDVTEFETLRALRNGGTCSKATWRNYAGSPTPICPPTFSTDPVGEGGFSIDPLHYNGWAMPSTSYIATSTLPWKSGRSQLEIGQDNPQALGCVETDSECSNGTEWVRIKMIEPDAAGALPPYGGDVLTISGNQEHDLTDYLSAMYANPEDVRDGLDDMARAGYLSPDMVAGEESPGEPPEDWVDDEWRVRGLGLYSNGLSLVRSEFTLAASDIQKIEQAENLAGMNGGLYIDLVGDDFITVYVNGCPLPVGASVWNSAKVQDINIPSTYLNGPQSTCTKSPLHTDVTQPNLIAIELMDRIQIGRIWHDIGGSGLGFAIVRRDQVGYNLTPIVEASSPFVQPGGQVEFDYKVTNSGVESKDTVNSVRKIIVPQGASLPDGFFTSHEGANCGTYGAGVACTTYLNNRVYPENSTTEVWAETVTANLSPGTRVCRVLVVAPRSSVSDDSRDSVPVCVTVAKLPQVQFWGDDVRVGDSMTFAKTVLSGNAIVNTARQDIKNALGDLATFGSWAEYGIFAPAPNGTISSASGGAISGPNGYTPSPIDDARANRLTFANTGGSYGKWANPRTIESIEVFAKQYQNGGPRYGATVTLNSLSGGSGVNDGEIKYFTLTHSGETISVRGSFTANGTAILITNKTVRISSDIIVDNSGIHSIGTAPQVIIIADRIIIENNVEQIDAWLVARPSDSSEPLTGPNGKISTCDDIILNGDYTQGLSMGVCNRPLRINGALIAKEVQFRRTHGADQESGLSKPAEVVNLRADAFMWARSPQAVASDAMPIETTFTTELPPRF